MLSWKKALTLLMAVAVFAAPASALANDAATTNLVQDYAQREAQATDLEQFTGGWHGIVLTVLAVLLVVWLLTELFDDDDEVRHHREPAPHVHP